MDLNADFRLEVPEDFDDTDEDTQVHPMARKLFLASSAAEAFRKAHEWVGAHKVFLVDVSWDYLHGEDEPYTLSIYFTFELDPEDA